MAKLFKNSYFFTNFFNNYIVYTLFVFVILTLLFEVLIKLLWSNIEVSKWDFFHSIMIFTLLYDKYRSITSLSNHVKLFKSINIFISNASSIVFYKLAHLFKIFTDLRKLLLR